MKSRTHFVVPLTVLLTVTAFAPTAVRGAGLNLGWDDCGGQPASLDKTFACDTNVGINTLVASFVAPGSLTALRAAQAVLSIQSNGATLPAWWGMRTGFCRSPQSLFMNPNFTTGPFTCFDYWQGSALGGSNLHAPVGNRTLIEVVEALPVGAPNIAPIPEGTEVYAFKLTIDNRKTIGLGSCAGCGTGVCIALNSLRLLQVAPLPDIMVSGPATRAHATWQGGTDIDCYLATPVRDMTWGRVKTLYR